MNYMGAEHYYFWQGVSEGVRLSLDELFDHPMVTPEFNTKVAKDCAESFKEGFMYGLAMTKAEYKKTVEIVELEVKPEKKVVKVEKKIKDLIPDADKTFITNVKGNC